MVRKEHTIKYIKNKLILRKKLTKRQYYFLQADLMKNTKLDFPDLYTRIFTEFGTEIKCLFIHISRICAFIGIFIGSPIIKILDHKQFNKKVKNLENQTYEDYLKRFEK